MIYEKNKKMISNYQRKPSKSPRLLFRLFHYDREKDRYFCPEGQSLSLFLSERQNKYWYIERMLKPAMPVRSRQNAQSEYRRNDGSVRTKPKKIDQIGPVPDNFNLFFAALIDEKEAIQVQEHPGYDYMGSFVRRAPGQIFPSSIQAS